MALISKDQLSMLQSKMDEIDMMDSRVDWEMKCESGMIPDSFIDNEYRKFTGKNVDNVTLFSFPPSSFGEILDFGHILRIENVIKSFYSKVTRRNCNIVMVYESRKTWLDRDVKVNSLQVNSFYSLTLCVNYVMRYYISDVCNFSESTVKSIFDNMMPFGSINPYVEVIELTRLCVKSLHFSDTCCIIKLF